VELILICSNKNTMNLRNFYIFNFFVIVKIAFLLVQNQKKRQIRTKMALFCGDNINKELIDDE
jgi:hypothetical protein